MSSVVVVFAEIYLHCWIIKTPTDPCYPQQNKQQVGLDRQDISAVNIQEHVKLPIHTARGNHGWFPEDEGLKVA